MSGHIFKQITEPIEADIAVQIQSEIINKITEEYPDVICMRLGSVGHKTTASGDIDIGVKAATVNDLYNIILKVFGYTNTVKYESLYIVSIAYPYKDRNNNEKYVQCDFIQVVDEEYTRFRYYCPDYTKNESQYKVGHRIMFLNMILNHCYKEKYEGVPDTEYVKFDFSPIGLYRDISERSNILNYLRSDFLTTDVNRIMSMMAHISNREQFNTVESLWEFIHSDNFKYRDKETPRMEISFFTNCFLKGWTHVNPEDFKLQYVTLDDIYLAMNKFKTSAFINRYLQHGREI